VRRADRAEQGRESHDIEDLLVRPNELDSPWSLIMASLKKVLFCRVTKTTSFITGLSLKSEKFTVVCLVAGKCMNVFGYITCTHGGARQCCVGDVSF
jgi:hypothetical protein